MPLATDRTERSCGGAGGAGPKRMRPLAAILLGAVALTGSAHGPGMCFSANCLARSTVWTVPASGARAACLRPGTLQATRAKLSRLRRQREQIDEALRRIEGADPAQPPLQASHHELPRSSGEIVWEDLPVELDPHFVTWRGVKQPPGVPETATIEAMKATLNPRSKRKRAQVENFLAAIRLLAPPPNTTLVDFGSGSGNLILPLAHLFPSLQFLAIDAKEAAIELLRERASLAGLRNVRAHVGYIEDCEEPFGVALGLHVCGPASDAVLEKAVQQRAAFLLSPCCIGKHTLQPSVANPKDKEDKAWKLAKSFPKSRWLGSRVDEEIFSWIVTAADRSEIAPAGADEERVAHFRRGGLCKTAVELDRLEWTREKGYETYLIRMWGLEDYSKKDLLVGLPPVEGTALPGSGHGQEGASGGVLERGAFVSSLRSGVAR